MATHHTTENTLVVIKKQKKEKSEILSSHFMLTKSKKSYNLLYGNTPYNRKKTRRNKKQKNKKHTFGIHYVKAPYHILVCKNRERTFEPPRSGKRKKKKRSVDDVR